MKIVDLLRKISGLKIDTVTKTFTCGTASFTEVSVTLPSNALAISAVYLSGTGSALLDLYGFKKSGNNAYVRVAHRGTGSGTGTFQVEVQYLTWGGVPRSINPLRHLFVCEEVVA